MIRQHEWEYIERADGLIKVAKVKDPEQLDKLIEHMVNFPADFREELKQRDTAIGLFGQRIEITDAERPGYVSMIDRCSTVDGLATQINTGAQIGPHFIVYVLGYDGVIRKHSVYVPSVPNKEPEE